MVEPESAAPPALVLTAGLGTRLRPLTSLRAKAAVPINGRTLAERTIDWLAAAGIRDLVLNLHHRPATIAARLGDGHDRGVRIRYSWEQPVLGSAGGPRHALPLLAAAAGDDFLIVNGDTLTDLDLASLLARHRDSGALVTMALIANPRPGHYGGVEVSDDGWVRGFSRARGETGGRHRYHFIGVQVAQACAFADLADGVAVESVNDLYPTLMAARPRAIAAHLSTAAFLDIGTPRDCLETSLALAEREGPRLIGARASVAPSALVERTVLWDDVSVGAGAVLRGCIVGDGVQIPAGARFERCVIVPADAAPPQPGDRVDGPLLLREIPEA